VAENSSVPTNARDAGHLADKKAAIASLQKRDSMLDTKIEIDRLDMMIELALQDAERREERRELSRSRTHGSRPGRLSPRLQRVPVPKTSISIPMPTCHRRRTEC